MPIAKRSFLSALFDLSNDKFIYETFILHFVDVFKSIFSFLVDLPVVFEQIPSIIIFTRIYFVLRQIYILHKSRAGYKG